MSLFFGRPERRSSDWTDVSPSARRRAVNADSAPTLTPVFAALRHLVDFTSTLPVDAFQGGNRSSKAKEIDLPRLFASQDEIGRPGIEVWLGQLAFGIGSVGNSVGWVVEANRSTGLPEVVRWLHWSDWGFDEYTKQWTVSGQGVPASRIVHIPWIVPPGKTLGLSPVEHYAAIVRAGMSAQEYADVQRGGGIPPAHLKNNMVTIDPEKSSELRDRASASFASGKPLVTGKDWDLSLMAIPPNHAQFIETLGLSANQVAAAYGIDPREIGGTAAEGSITYSTDESRSLNRANNMRPYIVRMEMAFRRLLPAQQFVKLNVDATIRTDIKTRTDVVGAQIADGRLSVNEAREFEDRIPVPGGDFHNVPAPKAEPTVRQGDTP